MSAVHAAETPQQAARRLSASALRDGFTPQPLHEYTDESGTALFWRIRLKHPETGEKRIRPMHLKDGQFVIGEPAFPNGKPLYRLHELAGNPESPVFIVEGESCADALAQLGLVATTSGGSSSAAAADWTPLAGREVTAWPDFDEPGRQYAADVAQILRALSCAVRVIDVSALGLPHKADVVDWLEAHPAATAADVLALPVAAEQPPPVSSRLRALSLGELLALDLPPREDVLAPWLPTQGLVMVFAPRGIGKTWFALGVAYAVASGGQFLNWSAPAARGVIYVDGEMPAAVMQQRLAAVANSADAEPTAPLLIVTPDVQAMGMPDLAQRPGRHS